MLKEMISNVKKASRPATLIIAFILGVTAGFYIGIDSKLLFSAFVVALVLFTFKYLAVLAFWLCLVIGFFYCQVFVSTLSVDSVISGCHEGRVVTIPKNTKNGLEAGFKTDQGTRFVVQSDEEHLYYRDSLEICFEEEDKKIIEGGYGRYLLSRYQSKTIIRNPETKLTSGGSFWASFFSIRDSISILLKRIFIGDKAVLASGLILGGSQEFSDSFKEAMKSSGTTHLVAVSGYNVSIITIVIFMLLRRLFSRKIALTSSIVILLGFCILTGASASVVRASIMGGLFIVSRALGRKVPPLHLLLMAVFLMILQNPFALFDVGLQLSFFATLGLILSLDLFRFDAKKIYQIFLSVIPETLIAQVFTLPILIYHFSEASIISVIPNALILPLVPLAMLMIFISVIISFISVHLGMFVSLSGEVLLRYFVGVIKFFGDLDFARVEIKSVPYYVIVIFYLLAIVSIQVLIKRVNEKRYQKRV